MIQFNLCYQLEAQAKKWTRSSLQDGWKTGKSLESGCEGEACALRNVLTCRRRLQTIEEMQFFFT